MQINWVKCSEQMPPDDDFLPIIAKDIGRDPKPTVINGGWFNFMAKSYSQETEPSWIAYTEEAWNELNSNSAEFDRMTTGSEILGK